MPGPYRGQPKEEEAAQAAAVADAAAAVASAAASVTAGDSKEEKEDGKYKAKRRRAKRRFTTGDTITVHNVHEYFKREKMTNPATRTADALNISKTSVFKLLKKDPREMPGQDEKEKRDREPIFKREMAYDLIREAVVKMLEEKETVTLDRLMSALNRNRKKSSNPKMKKLAFGRTTLHRLMKEMGYRLPIRDDRSLPPAHTNPGATTVAAAAAAAASSQPTQTTNV